MRAWEALKNNMDGFMPKGIFLDRFADILQKKHFDYDDFLLAGFTIILFSVEEESFII